MFTNLAKIKFYSLKLNIVLLFLMQMDIWNVTSQFKHCTWLTGGSSLNAILELDLQVTNKNRTILILGDINMTIIPFMR